jgi:predicted XRE-type DNA-binding protein
MELFEVIEKFERKINKTDSCWLWCGAIDSHGYGSFTHKLKKEKAHRFSYKLFVGDVPEWTGYDSICVLHKCDNPMCVNPDHLFLGTHAENMKDKKNKNRAIGAHAGELHHKAKLTSEMVSNIRKDTRKQNEIAASYGVDRRTIGDILLGRTWNKKTSR